MGFFYAGKGRASRTAGLAPDEGERPALLQEVHYLALSYHWSQAEILGLSRELRREYLGLIQNELEQRQREAR